MAEKTKSKFRAAVSPVAAVFSVFFFIGLIVMIISKNNAAFADFWQSKIASVPRAVLAFITNALPFSLAETLILSVPLIFAVVIRYTGRIVNTEGGTLRFVINAVSVCLLVFGMLFFNFSAGYSASPLADRLGLKREKVSAQQLYETSEKLLAAINADIDDIDYIKDGFSIMPYSISEMNKKLNQAYKKVCEKYGFISDFRSNVKPVALSEPWTYTHVAGVYTFFTGEANININFPDYTLPFTAAHEMAHQRGISREDEANFIAFLVCSESDDPYIRYSGYVTTFEYVGSALYSADKTLYTKLYYAMMRDELASEFRAYDAFFEKYRENKVAAVSSKVNDTYLKSQGQSAGTRSYDLVVDLAVAYYCNSDKK